MGSDVSVASFRLSHTTHPQSEPVWSGLSFLARSLAALTSDVQNLSEELEKKYVARLTAGAQAGAEETSASERVSEGRRSEV